MATKREQEIEQERLNELRALMQKTMRLEWMPPQEIAPNDLNWKRHPNQQRKALREFMEELEDARAETGAPASGWVGALLWNEQTRRLLDGHMRLIEALERGDELVPVLVISVDEDTENLILAFLDRIGTLFTADEKMSEALAGLVATESQTLLALLGLAAAEEDEEEVDGPAELKRTQMPAGGLALPLGAKFDFVVVLARTEIDWNALQDHFGLDRQQCPFTNNVGLGRVVDGGAYLYRIRRELAEARGEVAPEASEAETVAALLNGGADGVSA